MKVIISHDIDHISAWEHKNDLILPKFLVRSLLEASLQRISVKELVLRLKETLKNKWHNLSELIEFDKANEIPATFFIATRNGLGVSYSAEATQTWGKRIIDSGFDLGVHGIAHSDYVKMKEEFENFRKLFGMEPSGIRMHYLRHCAETFIYLDRIGYLFDASKMDLSNPFVAGERIYEFPLTIMDTCVISGNKRLQTREFQNACDVTKEIIEKAHDMGIKYFSILFHDRYFSDAFVTWKNWYIWLINYFKTNGCEFISYRQALKELV